MENVVVIIDYGSCQEGLWAGGSEEGGGRDGEAKGEEKKKEKKRNDRQVK